MPREEWVAQGRPTSGRVCPPKAMRQSGLLALNTLQARVHKLWEEQGLTPIGLPSPPISGETPMIREFRNPEGRQSLHSPRHSPGDGVD